MKHRSHAAAIFGRWFVYLLVALGATGCATVKLVGDYDEQIDKGSTALQKEVETYLVKLESTAENPKDKVAAYTGNKQFYSDSRVTISGLRLRADATERNSLTVRAFDKLSANIDELEGMHKKGITRTEITDLIRPGFTQQFTAILTFELAKRRGEKPDGSKLAVAPTPNSANEGAKK